MLWWIVASQCPNAQNLWQCYLTFKRDFANIFSHSVDCAFVLLTDTTDKGLISKIYKELLKLNPPKTHNKVKKWAETWTDISLKKTYKWLTDTWKSVHQQQPSRKFKSKPQWDTTLYLLEWQKLTRLETTNVGEVVEKGEPSYTFDRNASWMQPL